MKRQITKEPACMLIGSFAIYLFTSPPGFELSKNDYGFDIEARRAPKIKARRPESRDWILGERAANPLPPEGRLKPRPEGPRAGIGFLGRGQLAPSPPARGSAGAL